MVSHLSIVLVEDNDDLRELTADALRGEGHRVVALSCAEELEDHAAGAAADVFLIDLNLPGEDGFSLSRRIRQVHPLVGIIIVSARSDLQDKIVGYDSGADWYLPKPVPFGELSAALKSFARRRQAQQFETVSPAGSLRLQQRELHGPAGSVRLTHERRVAGRRLVPARRHADEGLLDVLRGEAHRIVIAAVRRPFGAFRHVAGGQAGFVPGLGHAAYSLLRRRTVSAPLAPCHPLWKVTFGSMNRTGLRLGLGR
jgi:DNA-binding response OmpR family regulator